MNQEDIDRDINRLESISADQSHDLKGQGAFFEGNAQARWSALTEAEVEQIAGNVDELAARLQTRYNLTKEEAERQVMDWLKRR